MRSWGMACPVCGQRKARRECPALGQTICTVCCATKRLVEIVSKRSKKLDDESRAALETAVDKYGLDAIVTTEAAGRTKGLSPALSELGFRRAPGASGYVVWVPRSRD